MYVTLGNNKRVYLKSGENGNTLSVSEQYATHWNAKRAARRMFPQLDKSDRNGKKFV